MKELLSALPFVYMGKDGYGLGLLLIVNLGRNLKIPGLASGIFLTGGRGSGRSSSCSSNAFSIPKLCANTHSIIDFLMHNY